MERKFEDVWVLLYHGSAFYDITASVHWTFEDALDRLIDELRCQHELINTPKAEIDAEIAALRSLPPSVAYGKIQDGWDRFDEQEQPLILDSDIPLTQPT